MIFPRTLSAGKLKLKEAVAGSLGDLHPLHQIISCYGDLSQKIEAYTNLMKITGTIFDMQEPDTQVVHLDDVSALDQAFDEVIEAGPANALTFKGESISLIARHDRQLQRKILSFRRLDGAVRDFLWLDYNTCQVQLTAVIQTALTALGPSRSIEDKLTRYQLDHNIMNGDTLLEDLNNILLFLDNNATKATTILSASQNIGRILQLPINSTIYDVANALYPTAIPYPARYISWWSLCSQFIRNGASANFLASVATLLLKGTEASLLAGLYALKEQFSDVFVYVRDLYNEAVEALITLRKQGLMNWLINRITTALQGNTIEDGYLKRTDNDKFALQNAGLAIFFGVLKVAGAIISFFSRILGAIISIASFLIEAIVNFVLAPVVIGEKMEHPQLLHNEKAFTRMTPYGFGWSTFAMNSSMEDLFNTLGDDHCLAFSVPGGYLLCGLASEDSIGIEFHPAASVQHYTHLKAFKHLGEVKMEQRLGTWKKGYQTTGYSLYIQDIPYSLFVPSDSFDKSRILGGGDEQNAYGDIAFNIVIFWLWCRSLCGDLMISFDDGFYEASDWNGNPVPSWWIGNLNTILVSMGSDLKADYIGPSTSNGLQDFIHSIEEQKLLEDALRRYPQAAWGVIHDEWYGDCIHIPNEFQYPYIPPQFEPGSAVAGFIAAVAVTTAVVVGTVVLANKIKWRINAKRAQLQARVEGSWGDVTKAAASGDQVAFKAAYKEYKTARFKNNLFASVFGGTKYSANNYWETSGGSTPESAFSEWNSLISDTAEQSNKSEDTYATLQVIGRLITGDDLI